MSIKTNPLKLTQGLKLQKSMISDIAQLEALVTKHSADFENETPLLGDASKQCAQVAAWAQSARQLENDLEWLNLRIQKTNNATLVTVELAGKQVTKPLTSWIHRRQKGCDRMTSLEQAHNDRGLKEQSIRNSSGVTETMKIRRYYDPQAQAQRIMDAKREKSLIDSTLEVVNATTDLLPIEGVSNE